MTGSKPNMIARSSAEDESPLNLPAQIINAEPTVLPAGPAIGGRDDFHATLRSMSRLSFLLVCTALSCFVVTGVRGEAIIRLTPIVEGLSQPLYVAEPNDGSGRLFIVEKGGLVKILDQGTLRPMPFIDLSAKVTNTSEMGLLGLAFHPQFAENGRFFVDYATTVGGPQRTVVAEYHVW